MRKAFNEELLQIAREKSNIFMVLADIGYGEIEEFARTFPDRFINCGVAEQNMTGVACGIAMEGNIAITYSIANFPTLRCLEQVRNDVCYHNANVKIVIIGGGMAYGELGISHHSTEDIAIMRALPNLVVLAPCDIAEARAATRAMLEYDGPVYFRCGYKDEPPIHERPVDFQIGRAITVREGTEAAIFFTGTIGINAKLAAGELEKQQIRCRLVSMPSIKPIDRQAIIDAARETGGILTLEEHNLCGGFGSAVAEVLQDENLAGVRFKRMALPDVNVAKVGSQRWLRDQYGLGAADIVREIRGLLR
jgi:transketolase